MPSSDEPGTCAVIYWYTSLKSNLAWAWRSVLFIFNNIDNLSTAIGPSAIVFAIFNLFAVNVWFFKILPSIKFFTLSSPSNLLTVSVGTLVLLTPLLEGIYTLFWPARFCETLL